MEHPVHTMCQHSRTSVHEMPATLWTARLRSHQPQNATLTQDVANSRGTLLQTGRATSSSSCRSLNRTQTVWISRQPTDIFLSPPFLVTSCNTFVSSPTMTGRLETTNPSHLPPNSYLNHGTVSQLKSTKDKTPCSGISPGPNVRVWVPKHIRMLD